MRDLSIAYGNGRTAKFWSNKTIRFDELCDRLRSPIYTSETAEEYPKLPKGQRDDIKDKGGFVAGHLRDNRRQANKVVCRSMLVYDLDSIETEFLQDIGSRISNKGCYYTTHSHTPEHPRARMIIPVSRDMSPDEFNAAARYYAQDNGFISMLDPCSFSPHQMMYWPTCPSNGEYLFDTIDGDCLDPDAIFAKHPNWRDCSLLPTTPKESKAADHNVKQQKDPLEKEGVVGLFNRVYFPISTAIDEFLQGVYEPTADTSGRYDFIPGEGSAGVVIYDDKFSYSHHATDPAGGKLCNAFDLVRLHKFSEDDEKKSYKLMCEFAMTLDKVKLQDLEEKKQRAADDFSEDTNWQTKLRYMPRSKCLENSVWNLMLILNNDPDFVNIAFNELVGRVQITGAIPWTRPSDNKFWRDADTAQLKALIDIRYETFSSRNHDVAFTKVVEDRHFNPLRDWLDALPEWDGVVRLENLYIDFLGANNTRYVKAATRKSFVAAVARIYEPGTKFDSVVVLVGPQGCGKSTIFAKMGNEYYSDSLNLTDMKDKSGAEKLQGYWILELGELAGLKKADVEVVKAFVSRTDDIYRPSYGRTIESHPRQCIIVGTTNSETGFLRDITGNRRFWPIKVTGQSNGNAQLGLYLQVIEKPARKVLIKRGIKATDYWSYCEEVGCDVWGVLTSMKSLCGEPVCLWLPKEFIKPGTSEYVQGVEVDMDYKGIIPDEFDVIELPAAKYLMFQGEPFKEEDYEQAIKEIWEAEKKYDPSVIGYRWDNSNPKIQLEPIGIRGYIELLPIK